MGIKFGPSDCAFTYVQLEDHVSSRVKIVPTRDDFGVEELKSPSSAQNDWKGAKWSRWIIKALLKKQFRVGIRCYAFADRITVITSRASFMQIVNQLVGLEEATAVADAVPDSTPPDIQPDPTTTPSNQATPRVNSVHR